MSRDKLSAHFGAAEFDCHNGDQWPPAARAALEYWCRVWGEPLRARFGPVRITSGFRPAAYNRSVGGAEGSFHCYERRYGPRAVRGAGVGVAADCRPARGRPLDWQRWALDHKVRQARLGGGPPLVLPRSRGAAVAYPASGFIHLDTGPARTWAG